MGTTGIFDLTYYLIFTILVSALELTLKRNWKMVFHCFSFTLSFVKFRTQALATKLQSSTVANDCVAGELCKLARVTGPEFPHPVSPVGRCLPATGRCRAVRYKRQCLPGFCTMCRKVLVNPYPSSLHAEKCVTLPLVRGLGAEKC